MFNSILIVFLLTIWVVWWCFLIPCGHENSSIYIEPGDFLICHAILATIITKLTSAILNS